MLSFQYYFDIIKNNFVTFNELAQLIILDTVRNLKPLLENRSLHGEVGYSVRHLTRIKIRKTGHRPQKQRRERGEREKRGS